MNCAACGKPLSQHPDQTAIPVAYMENPEGSEIKKVASLFLETAESFLVVVPAQFNKNGQIETDLEKATYVFYAPTKETFDLLKQSAKEIGSCAVTVKEK